MKAPNAARVGHLPTRRKWTVYITCAGLWLTGLVWVLFHYFASAIDEFGFERPHPGEHYTLIAHAAFAFATMWLFGVLWPNHVKKSWRAHVRRWSGGTLFGFTAWLILSGFLLYYLGSEASREVASFAHWIGGLAGAVPFAVHLLTRQPRQPKRVPDSVT